MGYMPGKNPFIYSKQRYLITTMARTSSTSNLAVTLYLIILLIATIGFAVAGDWNIMGYMPGKKDKVGISVKNYCESWRIDVELHNIRQFFLVPSECAEFIGKYMSSTQYKTDIKRAAEEMLMYLTREFDLSYDGKDSWVFDVDDTLLSTEPYYKQHNYGAVLGCSRARPDESALEKWKNESKAPAVANMLDLYNDIKGRGLKIFIISSRSENLRQPTVDNLLKVGYSGWVQLILRCSDDYEANVQSYMEKQRTELINQGYRIWGITSDQWTSLVGQSNGKRTFKIPNPMYYSY